jgi:dolichol kinase
MTQIGKKSIEGTAAFVVGCLLTFYLMAAIFSAVV